ASLDSGDLGAGRAGQPGVGHGCGGAVARGRADRAEGDRDRYAVDRSGVRAAREVDRIGDGIDAAFDEGVRAGDVVDAGVAGVLGDRPGRGVRRRVAPVDRRSEVAGGEARGVGAYRGRQGRDRRGEGADDGVDELEALGALDRHRRAGGDHQRASVGDVDLRVIDRIDDARAGDGDEHFAGQETRGDRRRLTARVVV